ncbi:MAG: helix-turn-helix transcriptional regulator [Clostridia bacterium]|nr:helix-turn-helix transcriptional regulator [Clostridia bacterium]MCR5693422.1 metalloregulator ArsR/SmtB family transcription factor [Clostridia bacterium]
MENRTDITAEAENFELTEKVKKLLPKEESLFSLADFFKVFGDSTRIRILYTLFESEMCVNDIACTLEMTVSAVSHQLKVLRQARLISARREGKSFIYQLADDHVKSIINCATDHLSEEPENSFNPISGD